MLERNQAALEFLLNRRSRPAKTLGAPAPDRDALMQILEAATRSPERRQHPGDRAGLFGWRCVPGAAQRRPRSRLGRELDHRMDQS